MAVRRIGFWVPISLLLAAGLAGIAQADPTPTFQPSSPFVADGRLLNDWGIDLSVQSGSRTSNPSYIDTWYWRYEPNTYNDLKPTEVLADRVRFEVQDDNVPTNHGGEAFDIEAMYFAYDADWFYFAILSSVPPDGALDPYVSPYHQTYSDGSRRRFFPGDLALSVDNSLVPAPGYEYGIVIAPSGQLWNDSQAVYAGKQAGQVWQIDNQDAWFLPDRDRAVNPDSFSNFKTTAGLATLIHPEESYTLTEGVRSYEYHDAELSFYYGPTTDQLPSVEGNDGDGNYHDIYYDSGWKYHPSSHYGEPIDTYVFEGKFSRSLFDAENQPEGSEAAYYVHWTMGCANDLLPLTAEIQPIPEGNGGEVPEPFSLAFAASAFGIVVGARIRRRRKRQGK